MSDKCFLCGEKYIRYAYNKTCVYCNYQLLYYDNDALHFFKICYDKYGLLQNGWLTIDNVFNKQFHITISTPEEAFRALETIIKNEMFI